MSAFFQWIGRLLRWILGPSKEPAPPTSPRPSQPPPYRPPSSPPVTGGQPPATQPVPAPVTPPVRPPQPVTPSPAPLPGAGLASPVRPAPHRAWTLLIFMAGDNGLTFETEAGWQRIMAEMTSAGYTDIAEMQQAGTSDQVACLVQFDTVTESDVSYRIAINPMGQSPTVTRIPEINTGDPNSLRDFIVWGQQSYPSDHSIVIIWNHGGGWKEEDLWQNVRGSAVTRSATRSVAVPGTPQPSLSQTRASKALFQTSMRTIADLPEEAPRTRSAGGEEPATRWIAADDSSKDFLDNAELQKAFTQAQEMTGRRVDIIGMDACLMAMVEVAYQLRGHAGFLVASQEIEPMAGWHYTAILSHLTRSPGLTPEQLAPALVDLYMQSYPANNPDATLTQSATDLSRLDQLHFLLRQFVGAVGQHWNGEPLVQTALRRAKFNAQRFDDPDYRDLAHFLRLVFLDLDRARQTARPEVNHQALREVLDAAQAVLDLLRDPERSPIRHHRSAGIRYQDPESGANRASGLAIYFPDRGMSAFYQNLDFRSSGWGDLIRWVNGVNPS